MCSVSISGLFITNLIADAIRHQARSQCCKRDAEVALKQNERLMPFHLTLLVSLGSHCNLRLRSQHRSTLIKHVRKALRHLVIDGRDACDMACR